jgi:hypothetical protein
MKKYLVFLLFILTGCCNFERRENKYLLQGIGLGVLFVSLMVVAKNTKGVVGSDVKQSKF